MPRNVSAIIRRCVHSPTDQTGAVAVLQQSRDVSVGHYPPPRNAENQSVNFLEDPFELRRHSLRALNRFWCGFFLWHRRSVAQQLMARFKFQLSSVLQGQAGIIRVKDKARNCMVRCQTTGRFAEVPSSRYMSPVGGKLRRNLWESNCELVLICSQVFTRRAFWGILGGDQWHKLSVTRDEIC